MFKALKENLFVSGLVLAATVGAGLFALPGVFYASGWGIASLSMILVIACIIFAHTSFWEALHKTDGTRGLLGIVREKLGRPAGAVAFWAIIGGLTLTLAAYLSLGSGFLKTIFPGLGETSLPVFWILVSLPALFSLKRFAKLEAGVVSAMVLIILFIFFSAPGKTAILNSPFAMPGGLAISFGALLFSLSGWTAIEPIAKLTRGQGSKKKSVFIALGTVFATILFLVFVFGIFGSTVTIAGDTISGLGSWPEWKLKILALLGVATIFSIHLMISAEVKNSLSRDSRWGDIAAISFVIFAPLLLVWAGLNEFQTVVALAGGIFLAGQYFFIILVSKKILKFTGWKNFFANLLLFVFVASALYEAYRFILQ